MQLTYYRGRQMNFGDDLNPVLWPRLLPDTLDGTGSEGFLGIGTLIGRPFPGLSHLHVFSSGAGYDAIDSWAMPRTIWCVRGPITARLLGQPEAALTDGAILAPEVLALPAPWAHPTGRIGVVPHWESLHFPGWQDACAAADMALISPIDTPANVCAAIGSMSLLLTESLHGAILADTMGVPWIPIVTTRNVSALKWVDWCLSVGVAFAPVAVPPPCAAAALAYGRPTPTHGMRRRSLDADDAMAEFRARTAAPAAVAHPAVLRTRAKAVLREITGRHALASRLLGFSPARTAHALDDAACLGATLSRASHRAELRERMRARLLDFARHQARSAPLHAAGVA